MEIVVRSCEYFPFQKFQSIYLKNLSIKISRFLVSLSNFQEKAPYAAKAEKRKTEYNKNMQAYNKKLVNKFFLIKSLFFFYFYILY